MNEEDIILSVDLIHMRALISKVRVVAVLQDDLVKAALLGSTQVRI